MNREEIIRMARDAGFELTMWQLSLGYETCGTHDELERFAALVEERLKWDGLHSCHSECDRPACVHTRKAVKAEREACAKVCDAYIGADPIAAAIRARGQQ